MNFIHNIQSVVLIGSGNVATHLAQALKQQNIAVVQVFSPNPAHAARLAHTIGTRAVSDINIIDRSADLYLISISDDQIENVSDLLPEIKGIVAHTSGITALEALNKHRNSGVFYPLQTFSKNRTVDLNTVPFCIEASDPETSEALTGLAKKLSSKVYPVSTEKRKQLHLAAVLVNNFPTYLYQKAMDLLNENDLDFDMLRPLITETGAKIMEMNPAAAQTGPARRGDQKTINIHKELLQHHPEILAVYELISNQIEKNE
ncbi:MAG: DUF2520 domain-containing protein [Bacteroidales bacterium]|nr:DUF2520 domain-containing protein [Bacteroidales bacterium]